jgi:hypothetical protein
MTLALPKAVEAAAGAPASSSGREGGAGSDSADGEQHPGAAGDLYAPRSGASRGQKKGRKAVLFAVLVGAAVVVVGALLVVGGHGLLGG